MKIRFNVAYILVWLWCSFSIFVMLWVLFSSFKTNNEFFSSIWSLPQKLNFDNYVRVWKANNIKTAFLNSVVVVTSSVVGILIVAAPAAYVLARVESKILNYISNFFSFGMGIPFQLILIPLFFTLLKFRLIGTLHGLILVYISLSLPFSIFLLSGFYKTIPRELEESAVIDGCTPSQTFWKIIFPVSRLGLIPCAMLNFIGLWNELLLALTFIDKQDNYTLSLGLYSLQGALQYTGDWVGLFAAFIIVLIPTLLLFIFLSKLIISGMTLGVSK